MADPTLHLTSAAYVRAHRVVWPHAYTIQAAPNPLRGELMDGRVSILTPTPDEWVMGRPLVIARRDRQPVDPAALAAYRGAMETRWQMALDGFCLHPGPLTWRLHGGGVGDVASVCSGAVLTCSCSRAHALAGECHRAWAAPYLTRAGWAVYADGVLVTA